jgi:DMSO/TMAO reductase YedYZ heme-binding membrane subunit
VARIEPYLIWKDGDPADPNAPRAIGTPKIKALAWSTVTLCLAVLCLPPIPVVLPVFWLIAVLVGYGAVALIALLAILPLRNLARSPSGRMTVPMHEKIALIALALTGLHIVVFLAAEPLTLEYLKLSQPRYMIAGNIAALLMLLLVVTSLERIRPRLFGTRLRYRPLHLAGSILLVVLMLWHMIGSAVYTVGYVKLALYTLLSLGIVAAMLRRPLPHRRSAAPPRTTRQDTA